MMYSNWKGHVRYINILTLLQGFRVKIVNVKSQVLLSLNSQKRLGYKPQKKNTKYRCLFWKSRSHVRTLILGFHTTLENTKIKNFEFSPSSSKRLLNIYLLACLQLRSLFWKQNTKFFHNAWHRHCFWVTCYVHENIDSPYVFELWGTNMLIEVPMRVFSSLTERRNVLGEPK